MFSGFERHPVCARRKQSRIAGNRLSRRRSATPNWTDWVKKLYEANATGKLPDKHFSRLLAEYDEEQAALEAP